jgi:hypothetical protein
MPLLLMLQDRSQLALGTIVHINRSTSVTAFRLNSQSWMQEALQASRSGHILL